MVLEGGLASPTLVVFLFLGQDPREAEAVPVSSADAAVVAIQQGDRCRIEERHPCAIESYHSAYDPAGAVADQQGLVEVLAESCDALSRTEEVLLHQAQLSMCGDVIAQHLDAQQSGSKSRRKQTRETRQLRELHAHIERLLALIAVSTLGPTPSAAASGTDDVAPADAAPLTIEERARRARLQLELQEARRKATEAVQDRERARVKEETRPAMILGTMGIAAGTLVTLSGAALMLNGAAWTACSRKYRNREGEPSTRCHELLGAHAALDPSTIFTDTMISAEELDVAQGEARTRSVRNWVLGSITLAAGIASIAGGAVALRRARDRRRQHSVSFAWSKQAAFASVAFGF